MARMRKRGGTTFALLGNHRCLDFVNTEVIQRGNRVDLLDDFSDLVAWLRASELLGPAEADAALRRWTGTAGGARALVEARTLRAHLRAMLEQIARGQPIAGPALDAINALLVRSIGHGEVVRAHQG